MPSLCLVYGFMAALGGLAGALAPSAPFREGSGGDARILSGLGGDSERHRHNEYCCEDLVGADGRSVGAERSAASVRTGEPEEITAGYGYDQAKGKRNR